MADQNDQRTDPPAEKSASLPLKKRAMAEESLAGYNRALESKSESDSDDEDVTCLSAEDVTKETLHELQIKAFYSVIQAFSLETSTMSNKRTELIEKLMNEWEIPEETHISFADKIQNNLLTLELMSVSATPLTKPASPSSTFVPKSGKSWGSVKPESLIGKCVRLRLQDETEFSEYTINAYDAEQEMHRVMAADSNAMEVDDPYSLIVIEPDLVLSSKFLVEILYGKVEKSQTLMLPTSLHLQLDEPFSDNKALLQSHSQQILTKGNDKKIDQDPLLHFVLSSFSYLYNHITQTFFGVVCWN